ncbi:endogenous retrovirus group K member 6 Gag polyprotein-like [Dasypus novemcinctus]|uniref:endogenous retrovirus group K member 6 Gag polyprotein-like n=1 Tax=Dasypus novemcinctus TaxID=9361 RepID=UPI002660522A|nr:endogenous retrovirus group K member 6 Gag polyprotein-like [Dasypus novemcinctus]
MERPGSPNESGEGSEVAAEPEPERIYNPFPFKTLKELKSTVTTYGPTAPYTLSLLEHIADGRLTPHDWHTLACSALSAGDYPLWKSEYCEFCKETAQRNVRTENGWTEDMLLGAGHFKQNSNQLRYDARLFEQVRAAALKAWKRLPTKGQSLTSFTSIRQGPEELFSHFVGRLCTAAERMFGDANTDADYVKQLAFENANAACQAAIWPYRKRENLSGYIKLCSDIGPTKQQGLAIAAAIREATSEQAQAFAMALREVLPSPVPRAPRACFSCGNPGHLARDCQRRPPPQPKATPPSQLLPLLPQGQTLG